MTCPRKIMKISSQTNEAGRRGSLGKELWRERGGGVNEGRKSVPDKIGM